MIEDLAGEFRNGRLVRLKAKRDADRDWLARYLAAIPNADRLGEIALVDSSSRIGQTGRIYYNGLLDENAAAHMAFGSGFAKTRTVPIGQKRYGVNRAKTHIDVMIGTDDAERRRHPPERQARPARRRRHLADLGIAPFQTDQTACSQVVAIVNQVND